MRLLLAAAVVMLGCASHTPPGFVPFVPPPTVWDDPRPMCSDVVLARPGDQCWTCVEKSDRDKVAQGADKCDAALATWGNPTPEPTPAPAPSGVEGGEAPTGATDGGALVHGPTLPSVQRLPLAPRGGSQREQGYIERHAGNDERYLVEHLSLLPLVQGSAAFILRSSGISDADCLLESFPEVSPCAA